jgi:hypothetical protein
MKHIVNNTRHHLKNNTTVSVVVPAFLVMLALVFIVHSSTAKVHDSELRFAETSETVGILGNMLPASCESGGNDLPGPWHGGLDVNGTPSACVWTEYCTGGSDPNSNNWEIWEYSNDDSIDYRNTGRTCTPPPSVQIRFQ